MARGRDGKAAAPTQRPSSPGDRLAAEGGAGRLPREAGGDGAGLQTGLDVARLLGQRHLCHCILHGWQATPVYPSSDVDLAITPHHLSPLEETLRHCDGARLVQLLQHQASSYYFVLAAKQNEAVRYLTLDAVTDYRVAGSIFFSGEELLRSRQQEDGLWVAAPPTEFAYLLVKKICKKTLPEKQKRRLQALRGVLGEDAIAIASRLLGARWGPLVIRSIAQSDWSTLEANLPPLKRALWWQVVKRRPFNPIQYWLPELGRRWRRWRYPTGICVVVLGSDGSGKSTLIHHLKEELGGAFRHAAIFHLRPPLVSRKRDVGPVTDPHGRAPYPVWLSCLKVAHSVLFYNLGYLLTVRSRLATSTLVLFDRYFDDLVVDPRRYRYGGPMGLARFARHLVPRPDLFLVLDVPEDQLLERKQEVSREELRRQREAYRQLPTALPNAVLLDASRPAGDVARAARNVVLDYLHRRYMQRRFLWFPHKEAETLKWLTEVLFPSSVNVRWAFSPEPRRTTQRPGLGTFGWLPLENGGGYLIPLDSRHAAVKALDLYNAQSLKARLAKGLLAAGFRLGMGRCWLRGVQRVLGPEILHEERTGPGLLEYLKDVLGRSDLSFAISLGTPGPHRKPVLLALSREGKRLAYVKVGANAVTNTIVQHEADILKRLASRSFASFAAPAVLHEGWWNERYVCVQSALPEGRGKRVSTRLTVEYLDITKELAATHTCWVPLKESEFWRQLHRQIDEVSETCYRAPLERGIRKVEQWLDGDRLPFHLDHGDFAPWNMKTVNNKIIVFDWEHASMAGLPAWDLFHFIFETLRVQGRGPREIYAAFCKERTFCAALEDYFASLALNTTAREPLLSLYLVARLAAWALDGPRHVSRFEDLQTLVQLLRMLEGGA